MDTHKIQTMQKAGIILSEVLQIVLDAIKPGITEIELDALAEKEILKRGGEPGFKKVAGYHHTICISTNDVVVHGIPGKRILKAGDIVGIDCGVFLDGFHTDMAQTIKVQSSEFRTQNDEVDKFLRSGEEALFAAIAQAKAGNRVGQISEQMQKVEKKGYAIVRSLVGHGVGRELHEDPEIPGYLSGSINKTPLLTEGQTIAIEIIYNMKKKDVVYDGSDDWTIVTKDGSLSGLFERTVMVGKNGPEFLTKLAADPV
jgi:methionyl aminopeptidase